MSHNRPPGKKLAIVGLIGLVLIIPLVFVYGLVSDRQHQARVAQDSIAAGWAGAQTVTGPVLVLPYNDQQVTTETVNGQAVRKTFTVRRELFISPTSQSVSATLDPDVKERAIYKSVIYRANISGSARFDLPDTLETIGVAPADLLLDDAELRFGVSDPRGLQTDAQLSANREALTLNPGRGPKSTRGTGVHANYDWSDGEEINLDWSYSLRGSRSFSFIPRGQSTEWSIQSSWAHPSFTGAFLPDEDSKEISADGFSASWGISNLALGQPMVSTDDISAPPPGDFVDVEMAREGASAMSMTGTVRMVEPVDLYSLVDRSVKYGFLFIGFTFLAFLMFDVIGGARVASAEYLLSGAGLILFFVMLLAFAEMIGFALAYLAASAAIIGLITSYSAAVLKSWRRASVIGGLLVGLYALLYVLLNLEGLSLIIGSIMLFFALAGVMYATRNIDWSPENDDPASEGFVTS
ncbi:Inner membrane protein CreD [Altererythrobacter insulae]|nr:Inner membrane protein CreD [Altererythrobacter insulae]